MDGRITVAIQHNTTDQDTVTIAGRLQVMQGTIDGIIRISRLLGTL